MATLTREEAAKRYEALPLPTTADEHWRFTDLRGFDPAAAVLNGHDRGLSPAMLDLDVAGRARRHREPGSRSSPRRKASRSSRCPADYPAKLVPDDDKFAMENLARWQHGLLVRVPKGVELEKPLYVQVTSNGGSLYWRMVVVAEEGARFTLIEDSRLRRPTRSRTRTRSSSCSSVRQRRSSTSRCRTSRRRPGTSAATGARSSATASSTG